MGNLCDLLSDCFCCSNCCSNCGQQTKDVPKPKVESSKKSMKAVKDYSSPSQLEVQDLTTVHSFSEFSADKLNQFVAQKGYKFEESIGSGTYATVFKTRVLMDTSLLKKNEVIACKVVNIANTKDMAKRMEEVKIELFVLEKIKHTNIVRMYEHFIVDKHFLYIFMEYGSGGDLFTHLDKFGPFDEPECRFWFLQILSGVSHLHSEKVSHRDLKLQNILLDSERRAFISDFGLSQVSYRSDRPGRKGGVQWSRAYCGTFPYMAPEIVKTLNKAVYYDPFAADVWALGVILFLLYNKNYPFNPQSKRIVDRMLKKSLNWNLSLTPSKGLKELVELIFEPDPDLRIKIKKLCQHYWLTNTEPFFQTTDALTTETETLTESTS